MANTIRIKRKSTTGAPANGDLVEGELAINTADQKLYSKDATTVFEIGTYGETLPSGTTTDQTLRWTGSAWTQTSSLLVGSGGLITGGRFIGASNSVATVIDYQCQANGNFGAEEGMNFITDTDNSGTSRNFQWGTNANGTTGMDLLMTLTDAGNLIVDGSVTVYGDASSEGVMSHSGGTTPNRVFTFDMSNTDYVDFTNIVSPGGVRIRDGAALEIYNSTDASYLSVTHDGTDVNWTGVNTTDFIVDGLTWFKMLAGGGLAVYDSTNADEINISHDGTYANINTVNTDALRIQESVWVYGSGPSEFRIYDGSGIDYATFSHDGIDFNTVFTNTTDWNITSLTSIQAGTVNADFDVVTATSFTGTNVTSGVDPGHTHTIYATRSSPQFFGGDWEYASTTPRMTFYETDQIADEGKWDFQWANGNWNFRSRTDADGAGSTFMQIVRGTGTAVASIELNRQVNVNDSLDVTGTITASGSTSANWNTAFGWGDHSTQNYALTTGDTFTGAVTIDTDAAGAALTIGDGTSVDGDILLKFDMDRSWEFRSFGEDATNKLELRSLSNKNFQITDNTGANMHVFTATGGYTATGSINGTNVTSGVDPGHTHTAYQAAGSYIGGSITDNQIAVGAATANSIEGSSILTYSGGVLQIDNAGTASGFRAEGGTSTGFLELHGDAGAYIDFSLDGTGATDQQGRIRYYNDELRVESCDFQVNANFYAEGTSLFAGLMTSSVPEVLYGNQYGSYLSLGLKNGGSTGVLGSTQNTDAAALKYGTYWAYDCYWDDVANDWNAHRTSLGRKWVAEMGYHNDNFKIRRYDGVVTSAWADSAWTDLLTVSNVGAVTIGDDLTLPDTGRVKYDTYNYFMVRDSADSNRSIVSGIADVSFIADGNNNGTGDFEWATGSTAFSTADVIMTLTNAGNLSAVGTAFTLGTTGSSTTTTLGGTSGGSSNYVVLGKGFDVDSGIKWSRGVVIDSRVYVDSGENMHFTVDESSALSSNNFQWEANGVDVMTLTDTAQLTVSSSAGDASLFLKADTSNTVETANPFVRLEQDGNLITSVIGLVGAANIDSEGNTFTNVANNGLAIKTTTAIGMGVGATAGFTMDGSNNGKFWAALDVVGNITVGGTVDGKDVSTLTSNTGTVTGTGANNQIAVWTGTSALEGTGSLTFGGTQAEISSGAPFWKFEETGVTGVPVWWLGADGGSYSLRLNNAGPYAFTVNTNAGNDTVTGVVFATNTDFSAGIDVTGNITVTGTVDGKDVSTLTSNTGTVTGTGVNNQVSLWSGTSSQDGSANLTFSASNELSLGTSGTILLQDNNRVGWGNSVDGQISYSSGSDELQLACIGTTDVAIYTAATDLSLLVTANAGVGLYYNNVLKFLTTTTGATLTGNMTVTSRLVATDAEFTGLGPLTTPGADDLYVGGYGIMGDRSAGTIYVTNANANTSSNVSINAGGVHGAAATRAKFWPESVTGRTSAGQIKDHGGTLRDIGFNVLPPFNFNATDTLEARHCGHATGKTNTSLYTLTGPTSSDVDFPVGGVAHVYNLGTSGNYLISDTGTCTMYVCDGSAAPQDIVGTCTLAPGGMATLWRYSTTAIYITGTGITV